ncbi:MAG: DJ-1/PfpI family protein [Burkholderiales bacterium]|jgi:4-methyl-5(b-hydroxyethyl)-thiazole monophosphate biosynthesis|nr:DJ-1/PfpI family protein [Burkholderiales bacterium]
MARAALFLIDGFEETEALCTADILRRGDVDVALVSLDGQPTVRGKHHIAVVADTLFEDLGDADFDMLILPGGTIAYLDHAPLLAYLQTHDQAGKLLAAICAAPAVFGTLGMLKDKAAVCYPGMEGYLTGARLNQKEVETDGHITTSKGPGTTIPFALRLLTILQGKSVAQRVAENFLVSMP